MMVMLRAQDAEIEKQRSEIEGLRHKLEHGSANAKVSEHCQT
jgi:hypothetical protein